MQIGTSAHWFSDTSQKSPDVVLHVSVPQIQLDGLTVAPNGCVQYGTSAHWFSDTSQKSPDVALHVLVPQAQLDGFSMDPSVELHIMVAPPGCTGWATWPCAIQIKNTPTQNIFSKTNVA